LCRADIATNLHPLEKRLSSLVGTPAIVAAALFTFFPGLITGGLLGMALLAGVIGAVYVHTRTRNWQRYKRYGPEP
jgi:hypothetical protein